MSYSYNRQVDKPKTKTDRLRTSLIFGFTAIFLLASISVLYFWYLPSQNDQKYLSVITPSFKHQSGQMKKVYDSYSQSVFTGNKSTAEAGRTELQHARVVVKEALSQTSNLTNENNLSVLPFTDWRKTVSQTNLQFLALQDYINDSRTFLINYSNDVDYITEFEVIDSSASLNLFFASLQTISQANGSTQLLASSNASLNQLDAVIKSVHQLNTPTDFSQISHTFINNLIAVNNNFIDVISGIKGENSEQAANSAANLINSGNMLRSMQNENLASTLENTSQLQREIMHLKTEHPLAPRVK